MSQQSMAFKTTIQKPLHLEYWLHLPSGYGQDDAKRWPMILFLHGAGERGNDVELVRKHGIPKVAQANPAFPFIAVSPQCPRDTWWSSHIEALDGLIDDITSRYAVDPSRLYLTGLSMGGFGTWHLGTLWPERFAALVPICGGLAWPFGGAEKVRMLRDVPIWVFHGAQDPVVPLESSQVLVDELETVGGNVRFTVYPEAKHDSWTETYDDPALYEWLLAQHR